MTRCRIVPVSVSELPAGNLVKGKPVDRLRIRMKFQVYQPEALRKIDFILRLEILRTHSRAPPLCAAARSPDSGVFSILYLQSRYAETLGKIRLILRLEFVDRHSRAPPLCAAAWPPDSGEFSALYLQRHYA